MKKSIKRIKLAFVILAIVGVAVYITNNMPVFIVPEDMDQVKEYLENQTRYTVDDCTNPILNDPVLDKKEQLFSASLKADGGQIDIVVAKFGNSDASNKFYKKCKSMGTNFSVIKLNFGLPGFNKSFAAFKAGNLYTNAWYKDDTVIFIQGDDKTDLKRFKNDFVNYIKKAY